MLLDLQTDSLLIILHDLVLYVLAVGIMVSDFLKSFLKLKSVGTIDRGLIGTIYVGDHYTLLHITSIYIILKLIVAEIESCLKKGTSIGLFIPRPLPVLIPVARLTPFNICKRPLYVPTC